jgi:hypothetical protein
VTDAAQPNAPDDADARRHQGDDGARVGNRAAAAAAIPRAPMTGLPSARNAASDTSVKSTETLAATFATKPHWTSSV